ncbi:MAG: hypothetical protein K8W52_03185 [Deltaproteobacteria bacterium]|nr:hypothetical protein [Deltaproteobacteria bacterium]
MTAELGHAAAGGPSPGTRLGAYTLGAPLWQTAAADVYRATGPEGGATVFVLRPEIGALPAARAAVMAAAEHAQTLPENKHLARTLGAGSAGDTLWVATEELDGSLVRDLLARKREAGSGGFGARGAGNLVIGAANGLVTAELPHGALSTESIVVNRSGRVRVVDLAVGAGVAAAIAAGRFPPGSHVAPEVATSGASAAADVYGLGALLYEVLIGRPLERGGPRPSEAVAGVTATVDELVARMCARDPERRFGSVEVVKELIADALGRGGGLADEGPGSAQASAPAMAAAPSLAQALSSPGIAIAPTDPALAAAMADTNEKWLIAKGRLDYGPFSLADVVAQIKAHQIVAGNIIVDKDTGARIAVDEHPLLGPMVDHAKVAKDDARRAEAEVAHQTREKKRGVVLYGGIALGVGVVGLAVYLIVTHAGAAETKQVAGVEGVGAGQLAVKMTMPKAPPKRAGGGGHRSGGGGAGGSTQNGSENLSFDMSDESDDDGGGPLDMTTVYNGYAPRAGQLMGCLSKTGAGSASIAMIIDGKSGRVTFVKVNGETSGALFACINGVLRGIQFPSTGGARTRAEFDLGG